MDEKLAVRQLLNVRTRVGRKADVELETASGARPRRHERSVCISNRSHDRKAKANTIDEGLGVAVESLEWLEEKRHLIRCDQRAGVGDRQNSTP
jgi:hypothetical protein